MMRDKTVARLWILVALVLGAGCGGGDPDVSPSPTATATAIAPSHTPTRVPVTVPPATPGGGVEASILEAQVSDDTLSVVFTLTNASGVPLTPVFTSTQDPAQARVRFTVAHLERYSTDGELDREISRYVNDVNPTRPAYDRNGRLERIDAAAGLYRYTFGSRIPGDADLSRTYAIGMQVDRNFAGSQLGANPVFDFVPAGGSPEVRAASTTEQCRRCHSAVLAHGNRRELRLCTLCHTEAAADELGRSVDLRVMIHKIHRGRDLPSIVGGAPGARFAIFSSFAREEVVFAEKLADGRIVGVGFPRPIQDCAACHSDGPTAQGHLTQPSTPPCTSCHDDVNPSLMPTEAGPPGTGHFEELSFPESDCVFCHVPSGEERDISVAGAHVIAERSAQLAGLAIEILGVRNHAAGETPIVSFRVTNGDGEPLRDLSGLNRIGFTAAGPASEYRTVLAVTAVGGGASGALGGPDGEGVFEYTFGLPIPADAAGGWALGAEAHRTVLLSDPDEAPVTASEAALNPVVTFSVDGSGPVVRRTVVAEERCESCHGPFSRGFSVHGNSRNQIEYCVLCHNPDATDAALRRHDAAAVERADRTATIDFKVMIHAIHTGEELHRKPYLVYGLGPPPQSFTARDFGGVRYPADRRECERCHASATYLMPPFPAAGVLGPLATHLDPSSGDEVIDGRTPPITAVCTSCHDSDAALAHARTQVAGGVEACTVCHMEGRGFAVSELHGQ